MKFLRNAWYVAAWDDEVAAREMFRRTILDDDVLLFRSDEGRVTALRNRCPHRFAPLHLGRHLGDGLECAYHGLRFGPDGRCTLNPQGDGRIPSSAAVQAFPLVAKQGLLWIWMGDPARADQQAIPDLPGLDPDRHAINKGYLHTPAHYELMTDNIMDLGHIEFIHNGLLGSEAVRRARTEVIQDGLMVLSKRLTQAEILPPFLDASFETHGQPVDRWLDVHWQPPAIMSLVVGVALTGQPERIGRESLGVHVMTPETESSTHYFWSNAREDRRDDHEYHAQLQQGLAYAFEHQDKPMITAQQQAMGGVDFWHLNPIVLPGDAGAIRARRILQTLIREEGAQARGADLAMEPQTPRVLETSSGVLP